MAMVKKWERLIWIAGVLLALFAGMAGGGGESGPKVAPVSNETPPRRGKPADHGGQRESSRGGDIRDEAELRKMANHALSTPSRTERFQRVMEILDRTTAENWSVLWKEYIRQSLEEGRFHEAEWQLFMNRVGEVAGPDAMEYFTHNGQNQFTFNRREVLSGWSSIDPQGALAWLKNQPHEKQPRELWGAVMNGAAGKDPQLALQLLRDVPDEHSPAVVRGTVDTLIQSEGLPATAKLLEELVAEIPEGASMPPRLVIYYQELRKREARMKWLSDSYPDMPVKPASLDSLKQVFEPGLDLTTPADEGGRD
jgi:hypothetical protein